MASNQIAVAGKAGKWGIPATTISWTGPSGTARTMTVLADATGTPEADIAEANDSNGELIGKRSRNDRDQVRFSAHPKGATEADAQAIAGDLPRKMAIVTIACAADSQLATTNADTCVVDDVSKRYSPDNEVVVDFTVTIWRNRVMAAVAS